MLRSFIIKVSPVLGYPPLTNNTILNNECKYTSSNIHLYKLSFLQLYNL